MIKGLKGRISVSIFLRVILIGTEGGIVVMMLFVLLMFLMLLGLMLLVVAVTVIVEVILVLYPPVAA